MILSGQTLSFTKWVEILRSEPLFAALSGFEGRTPGIGSFYDFSRRLFPETTDSIIRQVIFKPKDSDKDPPPRPGIVNRLVTKLLDNLDKPLPAFGSPASQSPAQTRRLAFERLGSALLFRGD